MTLRQLKGASQADITEETRDHLDLGRAMALFMGASFFAYLFAVTVHEVGHFLAGTILGVPENGIVLHPFDLSQNITGGDLDQSLGTPLRRAFSQAAGPLLNIILGVGIGMLLWRKRSPRWLPLLLWGGVAMLQESVGMIIGLVDHPEVESDWVSVIFAGVPPTVIALFAAILIIIGSFWMMLLLPLAGVRPEDAYWRKLVIILPGIPLLLFSAVVYLTLAGSTGEAPEGMALQNRSIALAASLILVAVFAALYRPVFALLDRLSHTRPAQVSWRDSLGALGIGAVIFVFQWVTFN